MDFGRPQSAIEYGCLAFSIPEGHEVTVYTSSDYQPQPLSFSTPVLNGTLVNADVLKLKTAGIGDDLIVQRIKMSHGDYKLEPDDISGLKNAGLSDAVISAMMTAATRR